MTYHSKSNKNDIYEKVSEILGRKYDRSEQMKQVTVYSKPNCMQCEFTKKFLFDNNIEYTAIDVYEDEQALNHIKELGFQSLPVVEIEGEEPFYGFRPERLGMLL